jgi:uncharacterized protein
MSKSDPLKIIDKFLLSDRAPENSMGISDLDGFLTGIVIGPELVLPGEWLSRIWGGETPRFKSTKQAERVISAIMSRYNEIIGGFQKNPPRFAPVLFEVEDGTVIASDWACGFHDAIMLRLQAWEPLLQDPDARHLLDPILVLSGEGDSTELEPEAESEQMREAAEDLGDSIFAIHEYWVRRSVRH